MNDITEFRRTVEHFAAKVVEDQEFLIVQTVQNIGGENYREVTISREKTLKALSNFMPKKPFRESLADYLCPSCRGYLPYDALNQPIKEATEFCSCCGQHIYWDKPEEW